jgi:hypothetical protein
MKIKYLIEGNIDFFSELYKSLDDEENPNKTELDNNLCLISKLPLTDNFVKLVCGHQFNYIPLYNDIVNHKLKFNNMEATQGHLRSNQIRCPYCRKVQNGLLPYYDNIPGVKKIDKVNYINSDSENKQTNSTNPKFGHCSFMYESINFNPELPESNENPKMICCNKYTYFYLIENDSNKYCYEHLNMAKKMNTLKKKEEMKKAKVETKKKEKEEKQKAKDELKLAVKLAKEEAKKEAKKVEKLENAKKPQKNTITEISEENKVIKLIALNIINTNEDNIVGCVEIIKTGTNKGTSCNSKIFCENTNLCKRHYNLKNKVSDKVVNSDNI